MLIVSEVRGAASCEAGGTRYVFPLRVPPQWGGRLGRGFSRLELFSYLRTFVPPYPRMVNVQCSMVNGQWSMVFEERPRISRIIRKIRLRIDLNFYRISRNESRAILAALEIIRFIRCIYDAILLFVPFVQFVVVSTFPRMVNGQRSTFNVHRSTFNVQRVSPCPAGHRLRCLLCWAQGLGCCYLRLPGSPLL